VRVVVVLAVVRKISLSCRIWEISSRINNEVMRHLHDVVQRLMARQMEWKKGFQMQFKKKEVVDVVVLLLKTARADISL
jgi:hypothetical protein